MSSAAPLVAACPRCAHVQRAAAFESLNAGLLPAEVAAILDGTFEQIRCARCAAVFQPEHPMLLAGLRGGPWIVMHPASDRPRFVALERAVEELVAARLAEAPPPVALRLRAARPRLVFGQPQLADAVRSVLAGLDAALLECARLLAIRRGLARLVAHGPVDLCLERIDDGGALVHGVRALPDNERVDEIVLPADALAEVRAAQPAFERLYPALFERPYVSASRYLYGDDL